MSRFLKVRNFRDILRYLENLWRYLENFRRYLEKFWRYLENFRRYLENFRRYLENFRRYLEHADDINADVSCFKISKDVFIIEKQLCKSVLQLVEITILG